jgi:hypothetical protein
VLTILKQITYSDDFVCKGLPLFIIASHQYGHKAQRVLLFHLSHTAQEVVGRLAEGGEVG